MYATQLSKSRWIWIYEMVLLTVELKSGINLNPYRLTGGICNDTSGFHFRIVELVSYSDRCYEICLTIRQGLFKKLLNIFIFKLLIHFHSESKSEEISYFTKNLIYSLDIRLDIYEMA